MPKKAALGDFTIRPPWQRGAAGQRELIAPAADSCEQVAQAAGRSDMPGMPNGFVIPPTAGV